MLRGQWRQSLTTRTRQWRCCAFEQLEPRALLSASALTALAAHPLLSVLPQVTNAVPYGYAPAQIRHAYGFDQVSFSTAKGAAAGDGSGQTIAIVDAYNDPNISSDLQAFDKQFGLVAPAGLTIVNQNGGAGLPTTDAGWSMEIALDVEWAHAVAPGAKILLVEAQSSNVNDLLAAVNYARQQPGVTTVSMSWGSSEFSSEGSFDSSFTTPTGHAGVSFVAATGDAGQSGEWPAVSPNVVAVGGTSLALTSTSARASETAWSGSNGGVSLYEHEPAFQTGVQSSGRRATPDVAYDANPNDGFAVYDSVATGGQSGWVCVGGTSAGAPQWAALIAIADQGRALAGLGSLQNTPAGIYALPSSDSYDVTAGGNSGFVATAGYDDVTGLGAPNATAIVRHLVYGLSATAASSTPLTTTTAVATSPTTTTTTGGTTGTSRSGGLTWGHSGLPAGPPAPHVALAALFSDVPTDLAAAAAVQQRQAIDAWFGILGDSPNSRVGLTVK